jgi:flagellar biosynthesis GTPase FlhF
MYSTFLGEKGLIVGSRDCIAGILKSMSLEYIPDKAYKDDPPITLALFAPAPSITLLDYNFPRIGIQDIKGFEVIIILFVALFVDVLKSTAVEGPGIAAFDVKKETQRLQKLESKAEEKARKQRAEEIDRETERLRKMAEQEYRERKRKDEEIARETERLKKLEGWHDEKPPLPQRPGQPKPPQRAKKHWWNIGTRNQDEEQWAQGNGYQGQQYSNTSARLMGYF